MALTYATGAYSSDTLTELARDAAVGSKAAREIDLALTNLVKQTFIALSGHKSAFPSIDSVVKECRDKGWKVQADWQSGRQLSVALWKGEEQKVQATLLFATEGDPLMSIPGVPSTPKALNSLCSDYDLGKPGGE